MSSENAHDDSKYVSLPSLELPASKKRHREDSEPLPSPKRSASLSARQYNQQRGQRDPNNNAFKDVDRIDDSRSDGGLLDKLVRAKGGDYVIQPKPENHVLDWEQSFKPTQQQWRNLLTATSKHGLQTRMLPEGHRRAEKDDIKLHNVQHRGCNITLSLIPRGAQEEGQAVLMLSSPFSLDLPLNDSCEC